MNAKSNLTDRLLVAMPSVDHPLLEKSVIYVGEHTPRGVVGVVINKLSHLSLGDIFEKLDIEATHEQEQPVYLGGQEHCGHSFILHKSGQNKNHIEVSGSKEILEKIAAGTGPSPFVVTLGYITWDNEQLGRELRDWLIAPPNAAVLDAPTEKRWELAASLCGVDTQRLSTFTGHA